MCCNPCFPPWTPLLASTVRGVCLRSKIRIAMNKTWRLIPACWTDVSKVFRESLSLKLDRRGKKIQLNFLLFVYLYFSWEETLYLFYFLMSFFVLLNFFYRLPSFSISSQARHKKVLFDSLHFSVSSSWTKWDVEVEDQLGQRNNSIHLRRLWCVNLYI